MGPAIKILLPDAAIAFGNASAKAIWWMGKVVHDKGHDPLNYLHDKVTQFADDLWSLSEYIERNTTKVERIINVIRDEETIEG